MLRWLCRPFPCRMHCLPPPTLEVLESVLAKGGLALRRELVTPSVRTQQCCRSCDQRRCATCARRAALAVCGWFQHESSSPCYRSSGGLVDCLRLSQSAASCGAASTADTTYAGQPLGGARLSGASRSPERGRSPVGIGGLHGPEARTQKGREEGEDLRRAAARAGAPRSRHGDEPAKREETDRGRLHRDGGDG